MMGTGARALKVRQAFMRPLPAHTAQVREQSRRNADFLAVLLEKMAGKKGEAARFPEQGRRLLFSKRV